MCRKISVTCLKCILGGALFYFFVSFILFSIITQPWIILLNLWSRVNTRRQWVKSVWDSTRFDSFNCSSYTQLRSKIGQSYFQYLCDYVLSIFYLCRRLVIREMKFCLYIIWQTQCFRKFTLSIDSVSGSWYGFHAIGLILYWWKVPLWILLTPTSKISICVPHTN